MGELLVRNLDDDVIAWLQGRAAAHGRSIEAELGEVLRAAHRAGAPTEAWERAARLRAETAGRGLPRSEDVLREIRDER